MPLSTCVTHGRLCLTGEHTVRHLPVRIAVAVNIIREMFGIRFLCLGYLSSCDFARLNTFGAKRHRLSFVRGPDFVSDASGRRRSAVIMVRPFPDPHEDLH